MKKIIPTMVLLCSAVICSQAQNVTFPVTKESLRNNILEYHEQKHSEKEKSAQEGKHYRKYQVALQKSKTAFKNEDYGACIYHYRITEDLGYFDPFFEYYAGFSHYKLWKKTGNEKHHLKAKELLELSEFHDYAGAKSFLNEHFNSVIVSRD